jgi:hypothetical protein
MTDSLEDIQRKVKEYAEANPTKPAIFGSAYSGLIFGDDGPKKEWLDAVVPDRPVILGDHTIHTMWANSKALEMAGIDKDTPNPPGGEYVRDSEGNPTGTMKGSPFALAGKMMKGRTGLTAPFKKFFGSSRGGQWNSARGMLGHLDPKTGTMQEWPMPGGGASLPYGMTSDDRNQVWLAQTGGTRSPATIVAFDTRSKTWGTPIAVGTPGPNTIRHMTFDPATRLIWFGTDQGAIGRITVPPAPLVR